MHEISVMQGLLRMVEQELPKLGEGRLAAIRLRLGQFSGVEPDLLRSAFEMLSPGSAARGARLELETVPLEGRCSSCGSEFRIEDYTFLCPSCGATALVTRGEEVVLESLTLEVPDVRDNSSPGT